MLSDFAGRRIVMVSGPPAAGKSAIAGPLAAELGFALIAKDRIKETLHDALGGQAEVDLDWSQRLGAAAMDLLWALAAAVPAPGACGRGQERGGGDFHQVCPADGTRPGH